MLDSPESGYKSSDSSPQHLISIDPQYIVPNQVYNNYQVQLSNNFTRKVSLNATPQANTQCIELNRLAILVNSISPTSPSRNDQNFSPPTKTKKNKPRTVKQKDNAQSPTQISNRSHLNTCSCGHIEVPRSFQSATNTTSLHQKYTAANIIPTKKHNTVNIENLTARGEAVAAENHNKQLYQAKPIFTQDFTEGFKLQCGSLPEQVQSSRSDKPSIAIPDKIPHFWEEYTLSDATLENINLDNYELPATVPPNSEQKAPQKQQLQESPVVEEPNCSRYPYTHTEARSEGKEFVTGTGTNIQYPFHPLLSSITFKPPPPYPGKSIARNGAPLTKYVAVPNSSHTNISPTSNNVTEMKYETQSGPPTTPSHLTSSGVEPPHSSQASGIVMGDSPAEVVGVDSLLMSPWAANGPEFLEGGVPDVKQTTGFQDTSWVDSLMLGSTVNVASAQSLMEIKGPLPAFTNYTGHLSINGISGHHYHTIASSGQRSSVPNASPTPSSNQEYYESPVVSSSTPCPQVSQKHQPQNHHQQQQQQHPHPQNQHQHQQQQQQLPQSTQQMEYDIDDIAEIIGSAIADTTVPGNGNGPSSEQTSDTSRDWIDIADWMSIPECSPKNQETTSPNSFAPQIYVTTTPTMPTQQHGSTLQNLLTQNYAPLLQARLQAGNAAGLQNASCGETPSSTSPYPPLSPPNRVSTSCSPDDLLHSSFATPSHPRKRSRSSPGSGSPNKKNPAVNTAVLPYGAESEVAGNPKKPIHRCHICSRAFLNKSNIKVHLRTHTGEKPFKCDVCSKAFRQKAHLIKHQQIHKRGGRE